MLDKITLDQVAIDDNYNFFKHYIEGDDDSITTPSNLTQSSYFSADSFKTEIGNKSNEESLGCLALNCQSIGGHWTALQHFLSELEGDNFRFDIIGLSEIFRVPNNVFYNRDGYHSLEYKTRAEDDDGRGGVGLFINSDLVYTVRTDLSLFIPHVCETLFIELCTISAKKIIVGIIYRPNTQPLASLDIFTETIA